MHFGARLHGNKTRSINGHLCNAITSGNHKKAHSGKNKKYVAPFLHCFGLSFFEASLTTPAFRLITSFRFGSILFCFGW